VNRLANASSPYLRQHAGNPVDWHEWGDEALALAKNLDRPILLSVGYAACHWCHVMAHESFEDPGVARAMNAHFVNIKVDREERPDLDRIYQTAHALLSQRSGGWPLTMFLTPEGAPYFGGTYFPREARHGLPGFLDLLPRIAAAYREQGAAIADQNARLVDAMRSLEPGAGGALPPGAPDAAFAALERSFDPVDGGFGRAPKFPHPAELDFCLHRYARTGDRDALAMVQTTLDRMADGGIHDQLAGGFCRYSVDGQWTIPHFEKMLYDNGALLALYAKAARVTGEARHAEVAHGIVAWLESEMFAQDGAFFASLDADSEGEEGRFYVWTPDEVRAVVAPEAWPIVERLFGLDGPPNFEGHAWHLRVVRPLDTVAHERAIDPVRARELLSQAKAALLARRATRVRPGTDDKVLTSWNALAVSGLATAARALDEPRYGVLATGALDALARTVWRDGRLHATRRGEEGALPAYLDDHAFLLEALVAAMRTRFRRADFDWAIALADALCDRFEDDGGGFWFTAHDHEALFHRTMPGHDNATPSGNGVAARALIALGHLAGEPRYLLAAERAVRRFAPSIGREPGGYSTLLRAAADLEHPPAIVVLAHGPDPASREAARRWARELARSDDAHALVFAPDPADAPGALVKGAPPTAGVRAWVCRAMTCAAPVETLDDVRALLETRCEP